MIAVLKSGTTQEQVCHLVNWLKQMELDVHVSEGQEFIVLGLIGLFAGGFFLYNVGADIFNIVPASIQNLLHYPDTTNAGIIPYLNIFVGLKVFAGLSCIVIAFEGFKKFTEEDEG